MSWQVGQREDSIAQINTCELVLLIKSWTDGRLDCSNQQMRAAPAHLLRMKDHPLSFAAKLPTFSRSRKVTAGVTHCCLACTLSFVEYGTTSLEKILEYT